MFLSKLGCRSKPHNLRYRELRGPHVESHVQREGPCGHSVLIGVVRSARIGRNTRGRRPSVTTFPLSFCSMQPPPTPNVTRIRTLARFFYPAHIPLHYGVPNRGCTLLASWAPSSTCARADLRVPLTQRLQASQSLCILAGKQALLRSSK